MKRYLKTYSYIFVIINILLLLLSAGIKFRFNIEVPFIRLCIAGFFISAFIALSWMIFTSRKGNIILKIILGFVALLPIVILLRRSFGPLLFRASFAIYIFSGINNNRIVAKRKSIIRNPRACANNSKNKNVCCCFSRKTASRKLC